MVQLMMRDYAGAVTELDGAIAASPTSAFLYFDRGIAHILSTAYELAIADFTKYISMKVRSMVWYGMVWYGMVWYGIITPLPL